MQGEFVRVLKNDRVVGLEAQRLGGRDGRSHRALKFRGLQGGLALRSRVGPPGGPAPHQHGSRGGQTLMTANVRQGTVSGRSGAEAGRTEGGDQAKGHQEGRGEAVEGTFETDESHDTHLGVFVWNPGGAGLSVWTTSM